MNGNVETRSFDDILDALSNLQRRRLLIALLDHNPQDDTPTVVVDDGSDSDAVERLLEMHHVHLPKLESYGFVEWDRENGEGSKGPEFEEVGPLLELLEDHEDELPADWL